MTSFIFTEATENKSDGKTTDKEVLKQFSDLNHLLLSVFCWIG